MTVYVDEARNRYGRMVMCHMIADTPEELHEMAHKIGMARSWYQRPGQKVSFPHYDVAQGRRDLALQFGAVVIGRNDLAQLMRRVKREIIDQGKTWSDTGWMT